MARTARRDPDLRAEIVERRPLPGVQAASALVARGSAAWVVQDDVLALAVVDDALDHVPLAGRPAGTDAKAHKADLEAGLELPDGRLVVLGSGSLAPRERAFVVQDGAVAVHPLPDLYEALRAALGAGVELNVEGAARTGDTLRLLQRGNGRGAMDAELHLPLSWLVERLRGPLPPPSVSLVRWSLGELGGTRLTFTDGLGLGPDHLVFVGAAEDSPDAIADGEVRGSAIGVIDADDARWAPITIDGRIEPVKVEGIARWRGGWWLSTDADDPNRASELLRVELRGPWRL